MNWTMLTTIIKREFTTHIHSLRFSLALVLCVSLMVLNALGLVHSTYQFNRDVYREHVARQYQNLHDNGAIGLWKILLEGPMVLYKQPSTLAFCAGFTDNKLPDKIHAAAELHQGMALLNDIPTKIEFYWPWVLSFPTELENVSFLSSFITIDWVFIIGVLLSLTALLLTHDAIIGEKESGTLKLVMANSLTRHTLLWGKFFGTMMVLVKVLLLGLTLNLLLILVLGDLSLNSSHVVRIIAMVLISVVYLAGCTSLGLLISVCSSSRQGSLTTVIFVWVSMVLLWPQMGKTLAELSYKDLQKIEHAKHEYGQLHPIREKAIDLVTEESRGRWRDRLFLKKFSDILRSERAHHQELENTLLHQRLQQVYLAQNIARLSPMVLYQYTMEAMAGTGLARYRHFIDQARSYAQRFEEALLTLDQTDLYSLHIPLVTKGLSTKKVTLYQVPMFKEDLSVFSLAGPVMVDLVTLCFFAMLTYLAAYLVWLRSSIAD